MKQDINMTVRFRVLDNIEPPVDFMQALESRGFTIDIDNEVPPPQPEHHRSEVHTDYPGIMVLIKKGQRKSDLGVISIIHIFGNKLYLCGTADLIHYVNKITRDAIAHSQRGIMDDNS